MPLQTNDSLLINFKKIEDCEDMSLSRSARDEIALANFFSRETNCCLLTESVIINLYFHLIDNTKVTFIHITLVTIYYNAIYLNGKFLSAEKYGNFFFYQKNFV